MMPDNTHNSVKMQEYLKNIKTWMTFNVHIKQIYGTAFLHVYNASKITNIMPQRDAEKLVNASYT